MNKIFLFIIIASTFYSFKFGTTAIYSSKQITSNLESEIDSLNKELIKSLLNKDQKSIESIFSSELLESMAKSETPNSLDNFFEYAEPLVSKLHNYQEVDKFLLKGTIMYSTLIPSELTKTRDYSINFKSMTKESYVSLIEMNGERSHCALFTIIYGKYGNQWKANILNIGNYSLFNHTAPYYYKKAKEEYDQDNLINSFINIFLSFQILRPGGEVYLYNIENDAILLEKNIMQKINDSYTFPIILEEIETKPSIFSINPQEVENTFSPMINYLSKIDLQDTLKLRLENEQIRKIIPQYFKGINKNNDFVCYKAFNKLPNDSIPVKIYGFVDKQKN